MARIAMGGFMHESSSLVSHVPDSEYFMGHRDRPPLAPGGCPADPRRYAYRRLREGVRLVPLGPAFIRDVH